MYVGLALYAIGSQTFAGTVMPALTGGMENASRDPRSISWTTNDVSRQFVDDQTSLASFSLAWLKPPANETAAVESPEFTYLPPVAHKVMDWTLETAFEEISPARRVRRSSALLDWSNIDVPPDADIAGWQSAAAAATGSGGRSGATAMNRRGNDNGRDRTAHNDRPSRGRGPGIVETRDRSEYFNTSVIPLPPAVWLGFAGLALVVIARRHLTIR